MKRSYVLAGTLILLAVMVASVGLAAAVEYYPELKITLRGVVWYFETTGETDMGEPGSFDGRTVIKDSVVAWCWGEDYEIIFVEPALILRTKNYVFLVFCPRDLPEADMIGTTVSGELTNGDTFYTEGGGFAWGRR